MKTHIIAILPPYRGMPTGHMFQIALNDEGSVIKSHHETIEDSFTLNAKLIEYKQKGEELGFEVKLWFDALARYNVTSSRFKYDPLGAINFIMTKPENREVKPEKSSEEAPF